MSLFRKEAVLHQSGRLTGAVTLVQPLPIKITVAIILAIAMVVFAFLFNAQYSRKETVRGFLIPNKGVIKSYAHQGGTIEKLFVAEGDRVNKGEVLATLIIHQSDVAGVDLSEQLISQLSLQLQLLVEEVKQHQALQVSEKYNLSQRKITLQAEEKALSTQQNLADEKLSLLEDQQQQFDSLYKKGFLSSLDKKRQQHAFLEVKQEKQSIARLLLQQQSEFNQVDFSQQSLPQKTTLRINNLKRQQAEIKRQLAQIKSNHSYTITASHAGIVTGIQVVEGETLKHNKPLFHILPKGSQLVAELLLPTRSAGFVKRGDKVRLRFEAFPYQRFGFMESEITRIDQTLIIPNEVRLPIEFREPVYRLRTILKHQQINAYGKEFNLKSGMLFEADIMLEQRSLIDWLLEPIYSLHGRVS